MIIARWEIIARFGHKPEVVDAMNWWADQIGSKLGWTDRMQMMTGSVGAPESAVVVEVKLDDLTALQAGWDALGELDEHHRWSRNLEPKVVSGTNRWEVYKTL